MPNWVNNLVTIEGGEERIKEVKARLSQPMEIRNQDWGTKEIKIETITPVFSFFNIIAPPADKLEEYHGVHGFADGERQGDTSYNWYNFNNREWGTKWDVSTSSTLLEDEATKIRYEFDTAWAPPVSAIEKLALLFPEVTITLNYEEEQGWGGEIVFTGEDFVETESYDSKCNDCDAINTLEYCDDCGINVCSECKDLGEANPEDVAQCSTHGKVAVV